MQKSQKRRQGINVHEAFRKFAGVERASLKPRSKKGKAHPKATNISPRASVGRIDNLVSSYILRIYRF